MTSSKSVRNTVSVNGALLRNDRVAAGFSQEALVAACNISFHIGTLRRAEHGENISRVYLESIANALSENADKYTNPSPVEDPSTYICNGDWTSFYIQNHTGAKPYIVEEHTNLVHTETGLGGYTDSTYRGTDIREAFTTLELRGNMLVGDCMVEAWDGIDGYSRIHVILSRSNEWADGITSWFDMDWQSIRHSRHIMVKNSSIYFDSYINDAKSLMENEILIYQSRYGNN